jgi:hypothetical protein
MSVSNDLTLRIIADGVRDAAGRARAELRIQRRPKPLGELRNVIRRTPLGAVAVAFIAGMLFSRRR